MLLLNSGLGVEFNIFSNNSHDFFYREVTLHTAFDDDDSYWFLLVCHRIFNILTVLKNNLITYSC